MARFDQTFLWVTRILESLFNMVGEHELALQVAAVGAPPGPPGGRRRRGRPGDAGGVARRVLIPR